MEVNMATDKMNVGLAIALPVKDSDQPLSELEKFTLDNKAEIILFPEDHIYANKLPDLQEIARNRKKWIVSGMEDRETGGEKYKQAVIVNPQGEIVGRHRKTSLTYDEISKGFSHGDAIQAVETDFGLIGLSICYEIHFPEVARIYALQGARIIFNPVGTGMWHENQFQQWNGVGRTRASENGIFSVGCSHQNGAIPFAYAYAPDGGCLVQTRDVNRMVMVTLDLSLCFGMFLEHRQPQLYRKLIEERKTD
jgi:predicted amidohydrolase